MSGNIEIPSDGSRITIENGVLNVPDNPVIPYIAGDGIGVDISPVMLDVVDGAVASAYGGARKIHWVEVYAGEKANHLTGSWLPDETIEVMKEYLVSIKGPLTTPVGGGIRSLNVAVRQIMDLYVCLRPVRWFKGVPSPVRKPELVDMVIFRENTEDIYAGIEFEAGGEQARKFLDLMKETFPASYDRIRFPETSGIGVKPVSREGSARLARAAIRYAIDNARKSVTFVHKGNIMKFTEGAFRNWGYEVAEREFGAETYTWSQWERTVADQGQDAANAEQTAALTAGRVLCKDAIADITLQQVLTRPGGFDVIATTNLNGDYLSDALAAQVGGIGIAPGGNINYDTGHAVFEATHGTAPKYAGRDMVNPGSLVLSAEMMLRYMGWREAADRIILGHGRRHRRPKGDLRLRPADGRRQPGVLLRVRAHHDRDDVSRAVAGRRPDIARCARLIYDGFERYNRQFRRITDRARRRFEERDWKGQIQDIGERLELYDRWCLTIQRQLRRELDAGADRRECWRQVRDLYGSRLENVPDAGFMKTFFNSISRRTFGTVGADGMLEFIQPPPDEGLESLAKRRYPCWHEVETGFRRILRDFRFREPYRDAGHDAHFMAAEVLDHAGRLGMDAGGFHRLEFIDSHFLQGARAYLVDASSTSASRSPSWWRSKTPGTASAWTRCCSRNRRSPTSSAIRAPTTSPTPRRWWVRCNSCTPSCHASRSTSCTPCWAGCARARPSASGPFPTTWAGAATASCTPRATPAW